MRPFYGCVGETSPISLGLVKHRLSRVVRPISRINLAEIVIPWMRVIFCAECTATQDVNQL